MIDVINSKISSDNIIIQPVFTSIPEKRDDLALQIIRHSMPLATLFRLDLKINIRALVKDQSLFQEIAQHLVSLADGAPVDASRVAAHFQDHPLLTEIATIIDSTRTLQNGAETTYTLFFQACADALNGVGGDLQPAIEGRIFTIKNGLLAQRDPNLIRDNQRQQGVPQQEASQILLEGSAFIRKSLLLHLQALQAKETLPFSKALLRTAKALLPFVAEVTKGYLEGHGQHPPENPLTWRNPTGYNSHGLTAPTVLGVCLDALGFDVQLMIRSDLEPKFSLATNHSIAVVTGPDGTRYIVDPCYHQFYQDICINNPDLSTTPVLVLKEANVDSYVENRLMPFWKRTFDLVQRQDAATLQRLQEANQSCAYPSLANVPAAHLEAWAKSSLVKIWHIASYHLMHFNRQFEDLFRNPTHPIHNMHIPTTLYLERQEIHDRIMALPKGSAQIPLLLAQLSNKDRLAYVDLLDCDPRLHKLEFSIGLNIYLRSVKTMVNPEGKDFHALYGCSGADIVSILLSTDATSLTMVDTTSVSGDTFRLAMENYHLLTIDPLFMTKFCHYGGASSTHHPDGVAFMPQLGERFLFGLYALDVDLSTISIEDTPSGATISFDWQYHGAPSSKRRSVTFITADITNPASYPPSLKKKISAGLDAFYSKASWLMPSSYPLFLPQLAEALCPNGWLMTTDTTCRMGTYDPLPCLEQAGLTFHTHTNEHLINAKEFLEPYYAPFVIVELLNIPRPKRNQGLDLNYWTLLNLRQKTS